jgi:asparagine N-glycosylation enzyme membrane subunit Stt3
MRPPVATTRTAVTVALGLGVLALALMLRSLGFEWVFVDSDTVILAPGDAHYHFRRALYGWTNFPTLLFRDAYINFPTGAAISWPPLFDFTLAALGKLFAADLRSFEVLSSWVPVVIGSLALWPVYALGRRLGGPALGLGAAALMAMLPMSVNYSRVGQIDHHCAVALIGACLLLVVARLVGEERATVGLGVGLAAGRIAMLLTWHGSLLYLALVEATLWVAAAVAGRRDLYAAQALSALATWVVVAPLVWLLPEPLGGAYSAIALSRLHLLAVAAVVLVSAGLWWLEGRDGETSAIRRLVWTAAMALVVVAGLLALPGARAGVEPALRFLTMSDGVGFRTGEQLPLFSVFGRAAGRPVWEVWGLLAYAIPVLPFAVVWAAPRERRAMAVTVAAWCAWFGALALVQRRYGNDLGPAAAVGFALVIAALARRVAQAFGAGRAVRMLAAPALALLLLSPYWAGEAIPRLSSGLRALSGERGPGDPALRTAAGSLTRFLEQVREVTPETSGYFDSEQKPEYGVVSHANFGHAIQNVARRPTPTDPFWAFIGVENWNAAFGLLGASSEAEALKLARRLRARYVMTFSSADPDALEGWLHHADGRRAGPWAAAEHFRLVTEGPKGGVHFARSFQVQAGERVTGPATPPYKLFEVVEGAQIEVGAAAGDDVVATLTLRTPTGREIVYEQRATAGPEGLAILRVPYPTLAVGGDERVRALAPYRVSTGQRSAAVAISEEDVSSGAVVPVFQPRS